MKLFVQWALDVAPAWEQMDSVDYQHTPKKGVPNGLSLVNGAKGWINALNVQGVEFIGYDHYAVEPLADGACRVMVWKDDPDDIPTDVLGEFYARVWTFQRLAQDVRLGGAWNTRQSQVCYAGPKLTQFYTDNPSKLTVLPWADFVPPAEQFVRHGVWLPDALMEASNPLRTLKDWREWTDGVPAKQIEGGKLRAQREQGLYDKPKGTKTYGLRNTDQSYPRITVTNENLMSRDAFGAGETESDSFSGGETKFPFVWWTVSNEPDSADWPSGNYRCSMDVTVAGADISYSLGPSFGLFARISSDGITILEFWSQVESAFTGTGIKIATTGTINPTAGSATDRFSCELIGIRAASHGNQSLTVRYSSDSFADGPWTSVTTHEGAVSESMSLAETDAAAAIFGASRSEALTLAETNVGGLAFSVSRDEALTLAETETAVRTMPVARSETLTLADSQSTLAVFSVSRTEALVLADAETVLAVFAAVRAEALAFADADSALATFQGVRAEAVNLVDSQDGELLGGEQEGSVSETLVLVDAVSAQVVFSGSLSEALALIETNEGSVLRVGSVSEALALVASEAGTRVISASITEQICVQSGEGTGLIISVME